MRSQSELRIISAQMDFLDERKSDIEAFVLEINSVIARCKSWMEEKEANKTSLSELLVLCAKIADRYQEDVICHKQITPKPQPHYSSDHTASEHTASEHTASSIYIEENDFQKKIISRLEVLEMAVSSLNTSSKMNENSVSDMKKTMDTFSENINERLTDNEQKTEFLENEQLLQSTNINSIIKKERDKVLSLKLSVQVLEEKCQEQYEELVHDVTSCNDAVSLLDSNHSGLSHDLELLSSRCNDVDNDVSSLKSSLQTLTKSQDWFQTSVEFVKQEQITQIEQLQTKVQTLQEQTGSSVLLLLKQQNTLRDILQSYLKNQEASVKTIEHLESEIQRQASLKAPIGYLASYCHPERIVKGCLRIAKFYGSTHLNEIHERNTALMLKCFQNVFINSEGDYNPNSGIFKARSDGLYIIHADILGLETNKHIYLGFVIRENNKIATLYKYKTVNVMEGKANFVNILHLKCGHEICIFRDETESNPFGEFACILLL